MLIEMQTIVQSVLQIVNSKIQGVILVALALSFYILKGKSTIRAILFTGLRNLCFVLSISSFTGGIKFIGVSDIVWICIATIAGFIEGFLGLKIIPSKRKILSNIAKLKEGISKLHLEKRNRLSKLIQQGLYGSYLNLLWHSISILLITAGIWFIIWNIGVIPYRQTASLIFVLLVVNKIREHWWSQWAWADAYVRLSAAFSSLHLPPVTTDTKLRLKHIVRFFYLNIFIFLLFLLFFPKFLGDESGFGLLIQYFGFTGTLLFFGILTFLILRFLGMLRHSQKTDFFWAVGYISFIGIMVAGFIAIFLNLFLSKGSAIISALVAASLLFISLNYHFKKRKASLNMITVYSLLFIILFAVEMTPKYNAMYLLSNAKKNLEYGQLKDARLVFEKLTAPALLNKEILGSVFVFDAHLGLSDVAMKMGDYATAKKQLTKLESKTWFFTSNRHKIQLSLAMANMYRKLGDKDSEKRIFNKVEREFYPEIKPYENKLLMYIKSMFGIVNPLYWKAQFDLQKARLAYVENQHTQALDHLVYVEQIGKVLGDHQLIIDAKNLAGDIYFVQNSYNNALENYNKALLLSEKVLDRYSRAASLIKIATAQNLLGKDVKENLNLAINISKDIGAREILWQGHYQYGLIFEGKGEYQKATSSYKEAIAVIESMRTKLKEEKERWGFIRERLSPYERLIGVLKKLHEKDPSQGYHKEALYYAERAKARTLLEALTVKESLVKEQRDKDILDKEKRLLNNIASLRQKLIKTGGERLREKLENAEVEYQRFIEEVKLSQPELASLITINPPTPEKIQNLLDSDTTLIEYYTGKDKTYIWLMTKSILKIFETPFGREKIRKIVNELLLPNISNYPRRPAPIGIDIPEKEPEGETNEVERARNRENFLTISRNIYKELFASIESEIRTKNLVIVPHGVLHKMPFAALNNGSIYLVDKYNISVLPSASVLEFFARKRNPDKGMLLALANPIADYAPGFFELPKTEIEVSGISQYFYKKEIYYRREATENVVKTRSEGVDVVHLASHGEFNEKQPLFSGLLLAKDNKNDGYLQVHEVFGLDLKNANLVTLSACETALSKIEGGDDLVGLSRGFIYAGSPSIIGTLWMVDDPATARFMEMFYENWRQKGMNKSEALRKAQLSLKSVSNWSHPYYWAPFILIGDWK